MRKKRSARLSRLDNRVNTKYPVWIEYLAIWISMLALTAGQAMILFTFVPLPEISAIAIIVCAEYLALMASIFCIATALIRNRKWDRPLRMLSNATREVAAGNFAVRLKPLRKDGKKDYVEVMFEDFNTMVSELNSTEMLKNDFISNVSHEIKTPLSVIQNYASALQTQDLPDEAQKDISTIISAAQKLNTLVTNILKLSKLDNQEIKPAMSEFDLCEGLGECALSFEDLWERKNIEFSADMDDTCVIKSDPALLDIVWNNLLSNALKFTEPGGSVTLSQSSDTDMVTVEISDTGCGMDEQTQAHIFDKFYQGDTSHSSNGNGLGLALTWRVVEILGGQIRVRSKPGEGTTFTVTLKTE